MPDLGDTVPLTVTVRDADGAPTNATAVTLTIERPDGTILTPTIANPPATTGTYAYDLVPDAEGLHHVHWSSTGPATAYADVVNVRPARPGYLFSLQEARDHLNKKDATDDDELRYWMEAATGVVERHLQQVLTARTFAEMANVTSSGVLLLRRRPVLSVTSAQTADGLTTWLPADLTVHPESGVVQVTGSRFAQDVVVTYRAGRTSIPAEWVQAAKIILAHLWSTQRSDRGSGRPARGAMDTPGAGFTGFGYALPNAAIELLGPGALGGFA